MTVDLVEINPGVLEVVERFGPPGVLDRTRVFENDARNFLSRTEHHYDIISSEPSYPTEPGVANLFTLEHFRLAAERLRPGGIYCQWLPYHMLTNDDVTMMLKTFGSVLPYVQLWKVPEGLDLILIGSHEPLVAPQEVRRRVATLNTSGRPLDYVLSRGPEEIRAITADTTIPVNTDDRPILEFRAARNLLIGDLALLEAGSGALEALGIETPEKP